MAVRYSLNELAELAAMQDSLMDRGSIADSLERDERNVENDPATPPAASSPDENSSNNSASNSSEKSIQQNSNNVGVSNNDDRNSPAATKENNDDPSSSYAAEHSDDLEHKKTYNNNEKEGGNDRGEEDDSDSKSDWRSKYYTFPSSVDNPPPLPVLITSHETHEGALRVWGHGNKTTNITADWKRAWAIPDQVIRLKLIY
jgi:DNA mismatch repair ATPase MutL